MDLGINGKRALVVAATTGLGFGVAKALADEGATVHVCGSNPERLERAVTALGPNATGSVADLTRPSAGSRLVETAVEVMGQVDILVTNAPGPPPTLAVDMSRADLRNALDTNLMSAVELCTAAVPDMRARGWGRIVAITSLAAREPMPKLVSSAAARAALTMFLKSLNDEVRDDGVTVNSVQPGAHDTERYRRYAAVVSDGQGRTGSPADFGAVVAFMCSEQARFLSGVGLPVAGGYQVTP